MKIKVLSTVLLLSLGFVETSQAAGVSTINWLGNIEISGFGALNNPDNNPNTMTITYTINSGSQTLFDTTGSEIVTGSIDILNFPLPGNTFSLNPSLVSHIAEHSTAGFFLPTSPTGITTNFPAGYNPGFNSNQAIPANVQDAATGVNSNLIITSESFFQNVFIENITEDALGINSLSALFNGFDLAGNADGIISRNFELDIQVSPVPVPAAAWLFVSGFMGMIAMKKKKTV